MSRAKCDICKRVLQTGDQVVRVETFVVSEPGTEGTTGWSATTQKFIHLDHIKRAWVAIQHDPGKGKW